MKLNDILIFCCCLLFASCSKKTIGTTTTPLKVNSVSSLVQKVNRQSLQATWIQAKGQVALDGGGFFSSGNMTVRSCKDSLIWLSVSKLGFEVMRGLLLRDSAYLINNYENTYWKGSVSEISKKYNIPAQLKDIQSMLVPALDGQGQYKMDKNEGGYELTQQGVLPKTYQISIPEGLVQSLSIEHIDADLKVSYSDYKEVDGLIKFPYTHTHLVRQANQVHETKIKFSQIQPADHLNTPFSIPSDFTLIK